MKKLLFAVQVFGAIAMFPLYVIVELNHGLKTLPVNNSSSAIVREQRDISTQSGIRNENVVFRYW